MANKLKHLLMIQRCIIIGLCIFSLKQVNNGKCITAVTVLQAKSDSDVMFCLQSCQKLRINRSLVYESYWQDRIKTQVIYRFALAQV